MLAHLVAELVDEVRTAPDARPVDMIRRRATEGLMQPPAVVERKVLRQADAQLGHVVVALPVHVLIPHATPRRGRSTKMLSSPRPSMLCTTSPRLSTPVKASLVNCVPWSLLNTSGLPRWRSPSSRQSTQNDASMLLLMRQASTDAIPVDNRHQISNAACQPDIRQIRTLTPGSVA